jgi:ABC-type transport system involved in cytochrome c biogenesis permease subunit
VPPAATPASPKAAKGGSSTAADLALLRRHPAVRNRVLGAVLVPFVLYAALLLAVGAKGVTYLLWIWIPLVSAGVLAGLLLDRAHKQHAAGG